MTNLIIKNIKKIYKNPSGNQSILVRNGIIEAVGPLDAIRAKILPSDPTDTLDASGLIALPGFVDSHTHLLFAGTRENELFLRAGGADYLEILRQGGGIHRTVEAVRRASEEELIEHGLRWLDRALRFGTTTIEIKSGYGLDGDSERKMLRVIQHLRGRHPVDVVPTFLVHAVPKGVERKRYLERVAEGMIPEFREYADWFDAYLEKGVFDLPEIECLVRKAMDAGYRVGLHANQANDLGGIRMAAEMGVRHVDHLEVLTPGDAERIVRTDGLYAVFLPSAEIHTFSERVGQIGQLRSIPDRIVLSTDFNPGTSPVLSPAAVMAMAVWRYRVTDPLLLLDAFTANPAEMLFLPDRGRIEPGAKADILLVDLDTFEQIPYYGTIPRIRYIVKNGKPIPGSHAS